MAGAFFAAAFLAGAFFAAAFLAGAFLAVAFFAAAVAFLAAAAVFFAAGAEVAFSTVTLGSFLAPETTALSSAPALNFGTLRFLVRTR